MQNVKYHILNIATVIIFSYITASTINQIIKYNISSIYSKSVTKQRKSAVIKRRKNFDYYKPILESGFFKLSDSNSVSSTPDFTETAGSISDLTLYGTITGPRSIARAMIKKRGEKFPEVFRLWTNVYGYKLVAIRDTKVYLRQDGERAVLDLFSKRNDKKGNKNLNRKSIKSNFSRAEIKQKVLNNPDNAMRGLLAGPWRENGKIVGFKLKKIKPYNILYKFGARSGDIVKRINGHSVNSTQKLFKLWDSLKKESRIVVDIQRRGQLITFDLNITD